MSLSIERLTSEDLPAALEGLVDTLHATVTAGASVSFLHPFSREDSRRFWEEKVFPGVHAGTRLLLVAHWQEEIAGTVQLDWDLPPNQPHRCEVAKLLVHPIHRKKGIARQLMIQLEREAKALNKTLITLDTRTGDVAEPLYRSLGYEVVGVLPGFARAPDADIYEATTYMYKHLEGNQTRP